MTTIAMTGRLTRSSAILSRTRSPSSASSSSRHPPRLAPAAISARYLHGGEDDTLINVPVTKQLPSRAQVVIAGSGLIGNSVAYHLVKEHGWSDVVIIDKGI